MGKLFSTLINELMEKSKSGVSLELRLVTLFLVFLISIMLCVSLILVSTGVLLKNGVISELFYHPELLDTILNETFDNSDSDSAILCSVPLIASDGTLLGVTGFEVGTMLFKSNYAPDNSMQNRVFCMLAPYDGTYLNLENAMFAGSHVVRGLIPSTKMKVLTDKEGFHKYFDESNNTYLGFDRKVHLYASDSPYEQEEWRVVLLVPEIDINGKIMQQNRLIIFLLVLLTAVFAVLSILISRKYLQPIRKAFDAIKLKKINEHNKTRIPEIDDLIEYLTKQDDKLIGDTFDSIAHNTTIFESFVNNIKTLSIAEKVVFDLYMKGHTSKEIANILCLSINTIKTHNRRIYTKLNISSRKELLVYTQMMNELKQEKNKKKKGC